MKRVITWKVQMSEKYKWLPVGCTFAVRKVGFQMRWGRKITLAPFNVCMLWFVYLEIFSEWNILFFFLITQNTISTCIMKIIKSNNHYHI